MAVAFLGIRAPPGQSDHDLTHFARPRLNVHYAPDYPYEREARAIEFAEFPP
ncbi:MAG: hypothetical protein ACP5SH_21530 [Syntrophobacteraceae bacterium]